MSVRKVVTRPITLTTGGTPIDILVGTANEPNSLSPRYRVTGTQTLSVGNFTIVPSGTPYTDETVEILWEASATLSGNTIAVFGVTIPAGWEALNWASKHIYNGSAWVTYLTPDFETSEFVLTNDIKDKNVTLAKIEDLARGHILVGNSSTRPAAVDFNKSGYIGIGDGTDYNSVAQSGDVIFGNTGVAAIQAGVIVNADVNASAAIAHSKLAAMTSGYVLVGSAGTVPTAVAISGDATLSSTGVLTISNNGIVKTLSVTIPTASVLTLFATPITIIPAQGAGTYVEIISATMQMTFGGAGVAYATNGIMRLLTTGAVIGQCSWTANGGLFGTTTRMVSATMTTPTAVGDTQLIANTAVVCQVDTGNPTAGNSDIVIKVCYRVIS